MPPHQLQPIPRRPDFAQSANKDVFGPLLSTSRAVPRATMLWHAAMLLVLLVQLHAASVTESGKHAGDAEGVKFLRMENNYAVFAVGSGNYQFQSQLGS